MHPNAQEDALRRVISVAVYPSFFKFARDERGSPIKLHATHVETDRSGPHACNTHTHTRARARARIYAYTHGHVHDTYGRMRLRIRILRIKLEQHIAYERDPQNAAQYTYVRVYAKPSRRFWRFEFRVREIA
jgi:hypothetical protein